jgi:hypothetical protein
MHAGYSEWLESLKDRNLTWFNVQNESCWGSWTMVRIKDLMIGAGYRAGIQCRMPPCMKDQSCIFNIE